MPFENRRVHPRAPYTERVFFWEWDCERGASGAQLGAGGVFLRTEAPPVEGSILTLRLPVPGERSYTILGRVVRTVRASRGSLHEPGMAIRFLNVAPEARRAIERYVQARTLSRKAS